MTFKLPEPVAWRYASDYPRCIYYIAVTPIDGAEFLFTAEQMHAAYEQGRAGASGAAQDAKRLDFLQETSSSLYTCTHTERKACTDGLRRYEEVCVFDGWAVGMSSDAHSTVRAAIDEAVEAQQRGSSPIMAPPPASHVTNPSPPEVE